MHRWWGSSQDSAQQSSERDQRAARRVIAEQNKNLRLALSDSEDEEYRDCNLSRSFISNLDGADDNDSVTSTESDKMPVVLFQDENGADDTDYYKKLSALKNRTFNKNEVEFWFTSFETSLKHMGVKSQWSKREVLHSLLPDEVQINVKNLLKKGQDTAGNTPYKDLKIELIKKYAPKPEAAFKTALSRTLTDKPSTLANQIIDDICTCAEPIQSACCQRMVWGLWSEKLPEGLRQRLAGQSFTNTPYNAMVNNN